MTKALEITGLKKIYGNGVEALKGIDLTVEKGDFFALLGPNGAGKSTTIGIMTALVNKSHGTVKIFGYDLDKEINEAKRQIGLVPQEFNFSVFETVQQIVVNQAGYYGIPRGEAMERSQEVLKQLGLWDKKDSQARMLSGGMKRRLMIARALMHKPKLLILDEPTAGVDIELRRSMWEFLVELNQQGTTIVLTTHYLEEAESLCRNIAIIDKGIIVEDTSMKDLLSRLDSETFVFDVRADSDALQKASEIPGVHIRDEYTLEALIEKSQGVNQIFQQLDELGIFVLSMRNKANRLEELFVRLVESKNAANQEADA